MAVPDHIHAGAAFLPGGWARDVRVTIERGVIRDVQTGTAIQPGDESCAALVPGMPNVHSHAFQRGMAGLAESRGPSADSFWTWRDTMYRFVDHIDPDGLHAIATMAYCEMLEAGFTRVGEFHYLHHDADGTTFDDPAEMSAAILFAAQETGIGMTLLPVFYAHAGFGGQPLGERQQRFGNDIDAYARLLDIVRARAASLPGTVVGVAPHSLRAVTREEMAALQMLSGRGPVHIHIAEQVREVEECLASTGARPVEWLLDNADVDARWCLVHATHMTPDETARLAASGAVAGLCPITEANLGDGVFPAHEYLRSAGNIGIGSDSNVRIDFAEELRLLEYGQRLVLRGRNILSEERCASTGEHLFRRSLIGGGLALGTPLPAIRPGLPADLVSFDLRDPAFYGRSPDKWFDSWIFAAGDRAIDCVWRRGRKVVRSGRHVDREVIAQNYRSTLKRILT